MLTFIYIALQFNVFLTAFNFFISSMFLNSFIVNPKQYLEQNILCPIRKKFFDTNSICNLSIFFSFNIFYIDTSSPDMVFFLLIIIILIIFLLILANNLRRN